MARWLCECTGIMTRQVTFKSDILECAAYSPGMQIFIITLFCCCCKQSPVWFGTTVCHDALWCDIIIFRFVCSTIHSLKCIIQPFQKYPKCLISLWHGFVHLFMNTQFVLPIILNSCRDDKDFCGLLLPQSRNDSHSPASGCIPALILETMMDFNKVRRCISWWYRFMEYASFLLQWQPAQSITGRLLGKFQRTCKSLRKFQLPNRRVLLK